MKFASVNRATRASAPVNTGNANAVSALLEAGKRLATALPLYVEARSPRSMTRTASMASTGIIETQVRVCIAALNNLRAGDLSSLRERLKSAIISINRAPSEPTARTLFDSPQVQETLWAWATAEANLFVKNMTQHAPIDDDKRADLVGDAVMGFMREESMRQGQNKLSPFMMSRTWEPSRMADPLGTLRVYLQKWALNVVQGHFHQQANEGVSLDAPVGNTDNGSTMGEFIEDKNTPTPESALLNQSDYQTQVAGLTQQFANQTAGLENDISALEGKSDSYSAGRRTTLKNRLNAIHEMVAPLLQKLQQTSHALTIAANDPRLDSSERERQVSTYRKQFDAAMQNLSAISEAQERAHGARLTREESNAGQTALAPAERVYKRNKPISDPISTAHAYERARANAERLLPHVYRALTQVKKTDLAQKYTSNLVTNWRWLDGIETRNDLNAALSNNPTVRATANDRALFNTLALRVMLFLRDIYTYDKKHSILRGPDRDLRINAKQRFMQMMGQEIERDPVLRQRATEQLDLLSHFVAGNNFRSMWDNIDHTARAGAYELARKERLDKRWDALSPDEANIVADAAGGLLYSDHRPFAAWSRGDAQKRVTKDLNLSPEERRQIMREEANRITQMMQGTLPRGTWAHGEPVDSTRFHDRLRAARPTPSSATDENDNTISAAALSINVRRFAKA